jgi:hypothetical protein
MTRRKRIVVGLVGVAVLALVAVPVYARACKMCKTICVQITAAMAEKEMDLTKAVAAAERRSQGKALIAETHFEEEKLFFQVVCWSGDRLLRIRIEEDGRATTLKEYDTLDSIHDPVAHKPKPTPAG